MAEFLPSTESKLRQEKYIFVLLGPSSSSKTTFGEVIETREEVMFLSTGRIIRRLKYQRHKYNLMRMWEEPDMNSMTKIKHFCHKLIKRTFNNFKSSKKHKILILDCVKDLDDAEFTTTQAHKHGLEITGALLFNVSPEEIDIYRMMRDREILHGSANVYLANWNRKSYDIIEYYKSLKLLNCTECTMVMSYIRLAGFYSLSHPSLLDSLKCPCQETCMSQYDQFIRSPVFPSSALKFKTILAELLSILRINQFQFSVPAPFVHCSRDVSWVANSASYHVTIDSDGL